MAETEKTAAVQTTETSLRIIEALMELKEARIEDVAEFLEIAPSTAHRHLQTLQKYGYVVNKGGFYQLGLQFLSVGGHIRNNDPAFDLVKDAVYELAEQTNGRVQFEVLEQGERIFLFTTTSKNAVQGDAKIGKRGPLHCSAAGKALLAELPEPRVHQIIETEGLPPITENTITNTDELLAELETIRERGIAFNREESTIGFHAVASSVTKPEGTVLGAISVAGPANRLNGERFTEEIPNIVRGVAQELELNIKYST